MPVHPDCVRGVIGRRCGRGGSLRTCAAAPRLWQHRWRLFFLSLASLYGHDDSRTWGVVQHRLRPLV